MRACCCAGSSGYDLSCRILADYSSGVVIFRRLCLNGCLIWKQDVDDKKCRR
jgi:hypothetical protein